MFSLNEGNRYVVCLQGVDLSKQPKGGLSDGNRNYTDCTNNIAQFWESLIALFVCRYLQLILYCQSFFRSLDEKTDLRYSISWIYIFFFMCKIVLCWICVEYVLINVVKGVLFYIVLMTFVALYSIIKFQSNTQTSYFEGIFLYLNTI